MPVTLKDLYFETRKTLQDGGVDNVDNIARDFIKHNIDVADIDIIISSEREILSSTVKDVQEGLKRRLDGEPVSRIFGENEFWGIPFKVTPDVLDPRVDTEIIVDAAIKKFIGDPPEAVLDLGTGSGCLIISLLTEWPKAQGVGVDVCKKALAVAGENARINKIEKRLKLVQSNWGDSVKGKFDVIVSNPPYIANHEMPNLPKEVKNYDPILALSGGEDGLNCYRLIIKEIKNLLKRDGVCFFEVGFSQADDVTRLVEDSGLSVDAIHPDTAGIPRVVEISFGEK